jgi:hypothetical protein
MRTAVASGAGSAVSAANLARADEWWRGGATQPSAPDPPLPWFPLLPYSPCELSPSDVVVVVVSDQCWCPC